MSYLKSMIEEQKLPEAHPNPQAPQRAPVTRLSWLIRMWWTELIGADQQEVAAVRGFVQGFMGTIQFAAKVLIVGMCVLRDKLDFHHCEREQCYAHRPAVRLVPDSTRKWWGNATVTDLLCRKFPIVSESSDSTAGWAHPDRMWVDCAPLGLGRRGYISFLVLREWSAMIACKASPGTYFVELSGPSRRRRACGSSRPNPRRDLRRHRGALRRGVCHECLALVCTTLVVLDLDNLLIAQSLQAFAVFRRALDVAPTVQGPHHCGPFLLGSKRLHGAHIQH